MQFPDWVADRLHDRITVLPGSLCWRWSGKRLSPGVKTQRSRQGLSSSAWKLPYGVCTIAGKQVYVHRLLYQACNGALDEGDRLKRVCGLADCVNPDHWRLTNPAKGSSRAPKMFEDFAGEPPLNLDFTIANNAQNAARVLDDLLAFFNPRCFNDVSNHPLMSDFSEEVIKSALRSINKEHLTWRTSTPSKDPTV
jgi:hypothetical protein